LPACADGFGAGSGSWIGNLLNGNQATGVDSAVVAGANNFAGAQGAFVGAGTANQATGLSSMVLGGFDNRATFVDALVGAGAGNRASGARSVIVGGGYNLASGHVSFIGGGGRSTVETTPAGTHAHDNVASRRWTVVVGGLGNEASADGAAVVGGGFNVASGVGSFVGGGGACCGNDALTPQPNVASGIASAILGGVSNLASGSRSVVAGGQNNAATGPASFVAGGSENAAVGNSATVGGGLFNDAIGDGSSIAGGANNTASGELATVAGGQSNVASGSLSFAAGRRANANAAGCFVFADNSSSNITSCFNPNTFVVRAREGFFFFTGGTSDATYTGAQLPNGAGAWLAYSDRNGKENVVPVDPIAVLDRVVALPISTWSWKAQKEDIRHMGPMAQDFSAAFGLGESDKMISTVDADGVALAAIQGLNAKLEMKLAERDLTVAAQAKELAELKRAVDVLLARAFAQDRVAVTH
jgi:hypothetical protein